MRRALRANYGTLALVASAIFTATIAISTPLSAVSVLTLALSLLNVGVAGMLFGRWQTLDSMSDELGRAPKRISVSTNEDEETVALVETHGGELLALDVPEGVVEKGPQAVIAWIVHELMSA